MAVPAACELLHAGTNIAQQDSCQSMRADRFRPNLPAEEAVQERGANLVLRSSAHRRVGRRVACAYRWHFCCALILTHTGLGKGTK